MCLYFGIIKDMKSIGMAEYQGRCDEQDKPVGHCPKVLKEYYNFIKDDYLVRVYGTYQPADKIKTKLIQIQDCGTQYPQLFTVAKAFKLK